MNAKRIYNKPRRKPWLVLKRAGYRAELYHHYMSKMPYIRALYERQDYLMLRICLKELKDKSLYFVNHDMGFCVTPELLNILIELLRFQGRYEYANKLELLTTKELQRPIIESEEIT